MSNKKTTFGQDLIKSLQEAVTIAEGKPPPATVHDAPEGFTLSDIEVGGYFRCGGRVFRCTDKGSRTIVAIRVDQVTVSSSDGKSRVLSYEEANRKGWFNGPSYAVAETVFDADDLEGCDLLVEP